MASEKRKGKGAAGKRSDSGKPGTAKASVKSKYPETSGRRVRPRHKVFATSNGTPAFGPMRIRAKGWSTVGARVLAGLVLVLVIAASAMFGTTLVSAIHKFVLGPVGGFILSIPQHLVTPLVAVGAAIVAFLALRQKQAADRKQDWWKRMQYGVDQMASDNHLSITVGIGMLQHLRDEQARDRWYRASIVDASDLKLFNTVAAPLLQQPDHAGNMEAIKEVHEDDEQP